MPSKPALLVIAHRGASGHRPENTLPAFERAIALGAPMIELDLQLTRDGAVVVLHDETLDRTTNGRGALRDRTFAEIRALDAGSWFGAAFAGTRIPTLDEVYEAVGRQAELNLELKGDDSPGELERRVLTIVERHDASSRAVFSSFSRRRIECVRSLSAHARVAVLMDDDASWSESRAFADTMHAEALHPARSLCGAAADVEAAHDAGLAVRVWSINDADEAARLHALGVDGIFTDFPERFREPR